MKDWWGDESNKSSGKIQFMLDAVTAFWDKYNLQFETNIFCNLRQIHFALWDKFTLQFWDKYILQFIQILTIGDPVSGAAPPGDLPLSRHVSSVGMDVVPDVCLFHPHSHHYRLFPSHPSSRHPHHLPLHKSWSSWSTWSWSPISDPQSEFTILNRAVAVLLPLSSSQAGATLMLNKLKAQKK